MSEQQPDGWGEVAYYSGSPSQARLAAIGHEYKLTTPTAPGMVTYMYCTCGDWGPWNYNVGDVDMLTRSHWMHRTGQDNALAEYVNSLLTRAPRSVHPAGG
jgi:hypothetical protein